MTYGQGRIYCDADSHIMETLDWVSKHADESIKDRLPGLALGGAGKSAEKVITRAVERLKDSEKTAEIDHDVIAGPKGWEAYGAFDKAERRKALDDMGFHKQLVFSTFSATQYLSSNDMDILYGGIRAHNRAMADFCSGDPRMIAVAQVALNDTARALEEIEYALELGCGAFWMPASPAGDRSPGHIDLDPVWDRLAKAKTPFLLHVGAGLRIMHKAYENNGRPLPLDRLGGGENLRVKDYVTLSFA
ncbi:MAG: amidohydrolase family protein, partial [Sphingomonadaceae bacterium]